MALNLFSVSNRYYKNGTSKFIKVSGGSPKFLIKSSVKNDMMPFDWPGEYIQINFIMQDNPFYIKRLYKLLT